MDPHPSCCPLQGEGLAGPPEPRSWAPRNTGHQAPVRAPREGSDPCKHIWSPVDDLLRPAEQTRVPFTSKPACLWGWGTHASSPGRGGNMLTVRGKVFSIERMPAVPLAATGWDSAARPLLSHRDCDVGQAWPWQGGEGWWAGSQVCHIRPPFKIPVSVKSTRLPSLLPSRT